MLSWQPKASTCTSLDKSLNHLTVPCPPIPPSIPSDRLTPSQSRSSHHTPAPRSVSVNGTGATVAASNEVREHVQHRPEVPQLPPTIKPPPNSRNLTPVSSAPSSPRHVPVSLSLTTALPPTTTPSTATVAQRRPSILVSTASLVHRHARRPSVYSRGITSTPSESPRVASAGDKGLRHVGEGALDDSSTQVTSYTSYLHPTLPPSTPPMTPSSPSSTPAFAQICPTLE